MLRTSHEFVLFGRVKQWSGIWWPSWLHVEIYYLTTSGWEVTSPTCRCHQMKIKSSSLLFLLPRCASGDRGFSHDTKLTWSCDHDNGIILSPMSLTTPCGVSPQSVNDPFTVYKPFAELYPPVSCNSLELWQGRDWPMHLGAKLG